MSKKITNPFNKEEPLKPFFEGDKGYIDTKNYQLEQYIMKNTTTNKLTEGFSLFTFFKSHLVASIIAFILVAGTFSAAAAELFAPEGIKPSTLLTRRVQEPNEEKPKDYTTTVDDFTFSYNREERVLRVSGVVETIRACYDVSTTSIVPTVEEDSVTYNLLIQLGLPADETDIEIDSCKEQTSKIEVEQTYDVVLEDSELERFDTLFTTRIREDSFDESIIRSRPFVSDDVYDVFVSEVCDLAIKHPKAINFMGEIIGVAFYPISASGADRIGISYPLGDGFSGYSMQCYSSSSSPERLFYYQSIGQDSEEAESTIEQIDRETLCESIQFTSQSCSRIDEEPIYRASLTGIEYYEEVYIFTVGDVLYEIGDTMSTKNIESTPFKFQFDSLAPSTSTTPEYVQPVDTQEEPINTPSPKKEFFYSTTLPRGFSVRNDLCGFAEDPEVVIAYGNQSIVYERQESNLFIPIDFVDRVTGVELFPVDNPMAFGFYVDCSIKTQRAQTSEQYLQQYQTIGYAIEDGTIRDVPENELFIFADQQSIDQMSSPKYIELGTAAKNPLRLIAFEYQDYIITVKYEHEVYKDDLDDLDSREILVFLKNQE